MRSAIRRWTVLAFVVASLFLTTLLAAGAARADVGKDAQRLVAVLEYVASDYPGAVAAGSKSEIDEQRSFITEAVSLAKSLPNGAAWVEKLQAIDARIAKSEDVPGVQKDCTALVEDVVRATGISRSPKQPPDLARGKELFEAQCASCHGKDGAAHTDVAAKLDPRPVSFRDGDRIDGLTPYRVFNATTYGVKGTAMPPFALDDADRWAVAFYVLSIRHQGACNDSKANVPLDRLANASDAELTKELGSAGAVACARTKMAAIDVGAQLAIAKSSVAHAVQLAADGHALEAKQAVLDAYLSGIEPIEPLLKSRDAALVTKIEEAFLSMRLAAERGERDLAPHGKRIDALLEDARRSGGKTEASSVFGLAMMILLREGFEVTVVIGALLAVLKKMNARSQAGVVHAGWISALFVGALVFVFARKYIAGSSREWLEGVVGLVAVAMLLYAAFWLNARSNTRKFMGELRDKMRGAIDKGGGAPRVAMGLFFISFSSMLRESVETAIFLQGLAIDSPSATVWGSVAGIAGLLVLVFVMGRFGLKLPLKRLFDVSTLLLFVTAVVLLGKAIHALQEVGIVPLRPVPFLRIDLLGIYPDAWGLVAQALLVAAPFVFRSIKRKGEDAPAGAEPAQ